VVATLVGGVSHPDNARMKREFVRPRRNSSPDPVGGVLHPDKIHPPGYAALRRFRKSNPHTDYFLTINLENRGHGLETREMSDRIIAEWQRLESEGHWILRTATVMPDHVHLLIRLGESISLDACIKLLKGRLAPCLRAARLSWQEGFYDHELRPADDVLPVFLYIYLNPYRAGLLPETAIWPAYRCCVEDWKWFGPRTKDSAPQPEWLR
jgi:putative transposase